MSKYTFFMDYKGGTYIDQRTAGDHIEAVKCWARFPNDEMLHAIGFNRDKSEWALDLLEKIESDPSGVVPITGIKSVWYITFFQNDEAVGLGVVKTDYLAE